MYKTTHQRPNSAHRHYEQQPSAKPTFLNQAKMFVALLAEMGNPHMKISADLLVIDTRDVMYAAVAATVGTIEILSKDRYGKF